MQSGGTKIDISIRAQRLTLKRGEETLRSYPVSTSRFGVGVAFGPDGRRPTHGTRDILQRDPHFRDHVTFFEYFHGDSGAGLGARTQTGWTALVAKLLEQSRLWKE